MKSHFTNALIIEFAAWETLLARLSEAQLTAPLAPEPLSLKDTLAHLHAWQQLSIARLEAARTSQEPDLPDWLEGGNPESEERTNEYNARIFQTYQDMPWESVHTAWKTGFLRFIELAEALSDEELGETGRYAWLKEYPLSAVLEGSQEHHVEHRDGLPVRLLVSE